MSKRQRNSSLLSLSGKDPKRIHMSGTNNIGKMDFEEISFEEGLDNGSVLNSTESMNAVHKNRIKELDDAMETLRSRDEPTLKDMANAMLSFMSSQKTSLEENHAFKKQLFSVTRKTVENSLAIQNLQRDFSEEVLELRAENNRTKQLMIENEVFISGFSTKPDPSFAVKEIAKILQQPISSIMNCFSYEFTNRKKLKESHIVIKFNSLTDKINFVQAKMKSGPIYVDQLIENAETTSTSTSSRIPIRIANRLTPTNRTIISKLRDLQTKGKIVKDGIRYRDCFYEAKLKDSSEFVPVPSITHLDLMLK